MVRRKSARISAGGGSASTANHPCNPKTGAALSSSVGPQSICRKIEGGGEEERQTSNGGGAATKAQKRALSGGGTSGFGGCEEHHHLAGGGFHIALGNRALPLSFSPLVRDSEPPTLKLGCLGDDILIIIG